MGSRRVRAVAAVLAVLASVIVGGGVLFYLAEGRERGLGLLDSVYWAFITATTIGYGDIYPETPLGRAVAFVVAVAGIASFTAIVGVAAEGLVEAAARRALGLGEVRHRGHIVVLGYSPLTKPLVDELRRSVPGKPIVVVDPEAPLELGERVDVVRGDVLDREVLRGKAGVDGAESIIVDLLDDSRTVLAVLHARRLNRKARIVAVVVDEENAEIVAEAGADRVVPASIVSMLAASYIYEPSVPELIVDLASASRGRLDVVEKPAAGLEGVDYCEAVKRLLEERGELLLAVVEPGGRLEGLPGCGYRIPEGAKLLVMVRG
ncbi:MAG: potassium channel family protein [Crenarchaeota archaeon]|nr:potassium channel family protein [Thermoproteota archaeon]